MRSLIAIISAALLMGCGEASRDSAPTQAEPLAEQLRDRMEAAAATGASGVLRVAVDGEVVIETGFGSACCNSDEPVTPAHHFMIGSITKEFTQVLGYVLEERGIISFDDTVSKSLGGFDGPAANVTLRQLLDHTSGLPDTIDASGEPVDYTVDYDYQPVSRDELVSRAALAELVFEPGTEDRYSNLGYQLLAAIYETATNEAYPMLLRRYVYRPAGMTGTDFWFADAEQREFADGCGAEDAYWGNPVDERMWGADGPSWNLMGAGGLLSTAESLAGFLEGIGAGVYFEDPAQAERYKASRMAFSERRQQRVMGTAGSNGIFNAVAYWGDYDRRSVVLMTKRTEHFAEGELLRDVMQLIP